MADERIQKFERLAGVVNKPEWDTFLVWISHLRSDCHDKLEKCGPDDLRKIQGELSILNDLLTLRANVNSVVSKRSTKNQS
jgi:hypothetical protein